MRVRLYTFTGFTMAPIANFSETTPAPGTVMLKYPYSARECFDLIDSKEHVTGKELSPANTRVLKIEIIPATARVHYEVMSNGSTDRHADEDSPTLGDGDIIDFGSNWRMSLRAAE